MFLQRAKQTQSAFSRNVFIMGIFAGLVVGQLSANEQVQPDGRYISVCKSAPRYFQDDTGKAFLPIGVNICFPRFETETEKVFSWYQKVFAECAKNKVNYVRIWLGHPFFELDPLSPGKVEPRQLEKLRRLVSLAGRYHIRLKLTLEHFRDIRNIRQKEMFFGAPPFSGKKWNVELGGPAKNMEDFLRGEASRRLFLQKLDVLSDTFRDSRDIAVWELWNEADTVSAPSSAWQAWTRAVIPEMKKRFPHHLVVQSCGSFSSPRSYRRYRFLLHGSGTDFAQIHNYYDPGGSFDFVSAPMDILAAESVAFLRNECPELPAVLAEAGAVEANHARYSHYYERDTRGVILHDILFAPFFAGSAGCGQSWHWYFYIEKNNLWYHFGRFARAVEGADILHENYRPFRRETGRLRIYGLEGKTHCLIWCRDKANTMNTELERGLPPETLTKESLDLLAFPRGEQLKKAAYYLPWQDRSGELQAGTDRMLKLPSFSTSIVLKLSY